MKILVIGAGAIGGSLAAYLCAASADVTILELNPDTCNCIVNNGLTVVDGEKTFSSAVEIVNSADELKGKVFDCCFSATRAYNMPAAVKSVLPYLTGDSLIVAMNNGVCIDELAEIVGYDRAVGGMINYGVGISSPGNYYIKIRGDLILGMVRKNNSKSIPKSLVRLNELLNKAIPASITDNIIGCLYSKMLINSCITSSALISGLPLGSILKNKKGRALFTAVATEGIAVAKAAGITVPRYAEKLNYYSLVKNDLFHKIKRCLTYNIMAKKYKSRTSASLEALRKGVKTETYYFNGYIARLGRKYGIPTPANDKICELINRVENDIALISPHNLNFGF